MEARERYLATILFGQPDRIPLIPGFGRQSTRKRWEAEGLPKEVKDVAEYAFRQAGGTLEWPSSGPGFPVDSRMIPTFEEKVLEVRERSQVVQDWKGNICEIGLEFTTAHLRQAIDFCTRRWIKCPVESRQDWEEMKRRYDPADRARLPANPKEKGQALQDRSYPLKLSINGPFWQLREWLGFENLCILFLEEPGWVAEMATFWGAFVERLLERVFAHYLPDHVHISEDMAYKEHPMISPEMTRTFLLPVYQSWGRIIRQAGIPVYGVDSDGHVGSLIEVWMEAGVNLCDPMEVAAGNDLPAYRTRFGRRMAFEGGVDKRAMAKGGEVIEREIARLRPVIESGGYIPGCDHGVPSDVSWPNFVRYTGLLARATGWM